MKLILWTFVSVAPMLALDCDQNTWKQKDRGGFCEIREQALTTTGRFRVDGGINGGVSVKGWKRADVVLRAQVQTNAEDDSAARGLSTQIRIDTSAGQIRAQGPQVTGRRSGWSVSFELMVPERTDLLLKTLNGGISISDVHGRIEFAAVNGGVHLSRLAGDVEGHTTNGGLSVELVGDRWEGTKLDTYTSNGGVTLRVPERYSANFETGTENGRLTLDIPVNVRGDISKRLKLDLGSGGPLVRVVTTNGGVTVRKS